MDRLTDRIPPGPMNVVPTKSATSVLASCTCPRTLGITLQCDVSSSFRTIQYYCCVYIVQPSIMRRNLRMLCACIPVSVASVLPVWLWHPVARGSQPVWVSLSLALPPCWTVGLAASDSGLRLTKTTRLSLSLPCGCTSIKVPEHTGTSDLARSVRYNNPRDIYSQDKITLDTVLALHTAILRQKSI
ncbi:hypothetical protein BC827DRAFT_757694 [Russula dissimulans]|nr:hypothetical protein BC827DRAFT_757694 [Russula dissimulans]